MPNMRFTPPFMSSNPPLYFLIAVTAALLLFTLLADADNVVAQTPTVTFTPTLTPTSTSVTNGSPGSEDVSAKLNALEERQEAMQASLGIVQRLAETLQALIDALSVRVDALDRGYYPTVTPSPTSLPTLTPTPTRAPGSTPAPTATPTLTPTPTLASACIRKTGLGWLTGTWNADCLSDRTPPTAKAGTRYARFYTFTLDSLATVTVGIASTDVADTYLYLLEGVGNEGAVVNRGDARITDQLQEGAYTIEATTYNLQTGGNFTLTLDISR